METGENNTNQNPSPAPQQNQPAQAPVDNTTLMAVLAYIGPLVIIPFLMAKDNTFVKFHIKQGLVVFVIEAAVYVLGMVMYLGAIWALMSLINLATLVLSIIGIVNVVQKKEAELPLVGQFAKHFNI